jgi:amino acid transporter
MPFRDIEPASSQAARPVPRPTELKRSLTLTDLIIYGLVFIGPIAPFAFYGYISTTAKGMVVLAYIVGAFAMFFTAYSYKLLSADFPLAGSVFAYARRAIGEKTGFVAGWMLVLDYVLLPAAVYLAAANALHEIVTSLPRWALVIGFIAIGTVINYIGVQITALVNKVIVAVELIILAAFVTMGLYALYHGAGAGHLTLKPLYQANVFSVGLVFSAVSLSALSFLGFDAISMLAEETKGDSKRLIGRATIASLVLAAVLFVAQTWIAADLANGMTFSSPDTAFYEIVAIAGGKTFSLVTAFVCAVAFGLSSASVVQASIARLLYAMAREGRMPAFMAAVHPKFRTPHNSILFVSAASVVVSMAFLDHFETIGILVNFGALTGFLILHVTVVFHFIVRQRSRAYVRHLVCPSIGFCILTYVLYYMDPSAWVLGLAWLALGLVGYWIFVVRLRAPESPAAVDAA